MWSDRVTRIKWKRDRKSNGGWSYVGIMYRLLRGVALRPHVYGIRHVMYGIASFHEATLG